jgi:hypothetical protein
MTEDTDTSSGLGASSRTYPLLKVGLTVASGLFVLGLYFLAFRPMTNDLAELEAELERTYQRMAETGFGYPQEPEKHLENARQSWETTQKLFNELSRRVTFYPGIEALLESPFRVLEFEQRRFDIQQNLRQLAAEHGSTLPAEVFQSLPSYSEITEPPQQLWMHLEFFNHVLTALLSGGSERQVERVESLPIKEIGGVSETGVSLLKLQIRLKVKGSAPSLAAFLNGSLPGGNDAKSAVTKKAYSIERLDLQDDPTSGDGDIILDALLTGFTFTQQAK